MALMVDSVDFTSAALADLGRTITRYAATIVNDNETGKPVLTFASGTSFTGVFLRKEQMFKLDNSGWVEQGDAFVMVESTTTLNKADEIEIDSGRYRVDDRITRYFGAEAMFSYARLMFVSG